MQLLGVRPLRRVEYDRLVEAGDFEGEHVELLHGAIVPLSPTGSRHASIVTRVQRRLVRQVSDRAIVRVQQPFAASDTSEPEPDVAVVPWVDDEYEHGHPSSAHLVIEVSDSYLERDQTIKAPLYAASNVTEYWIVDLGRDVVEVYSQPDAGQYTAMTTHGAGAALPVPAQADVVIGTDEVFGRA